MGSIFHVFTNAIANEAPAGRVRPVDWNSAHAYSLQDAISAGTTRITNGEAVFSNANGVSFGANGQTVTASVAQSTQPGLQSLSAGTTRVTTGEVVFSNANGVSFGADGQTVTASHNGLTSQSNQAFSAQGGSSAFQTLSFSNANGISFSNNAGQVEASYTVPTVTNSAWSVSDAATSGTVARLAFTNLNGITLSLSTGAGGSHTIVGSYTVPTVTNSSMTVSDAATSGTLARLAFTNLNGVTLSLSTGAGGSHTIVGSHNAVTSQSVQTVGIYAVSNTTQGTSGTFDARTISFNGAGNVSVGITNGSVVISGGTAAAAPVNFSAGTTSNNLGTVVFSNSNLVSFGLDGSTITASIPHISRWNNYIAPTIAGQTQQNQSASIFPVQIQAPLVCSAGKVQLSLNVATTNNTSSAFIDLSLSAVLYSRNVSTLSSLFSGSVSLTNSWGSNNTGSVTGVQYLPWTYVQTTLSPGDYWWAIHISTTNSATGGANTTGLNNTISMQISHGAATNVFAARSWADGTNSTQNGPLIGQGILGTSQTVASIALSDYIVTGSRGAIAGLIIEMAAANAY